MNLRRTKIVATLGPQTDSTQIIDAMIREGLDVARLNMSHGDHAIQKWRAELLRSRAIINEKPVGILVDLQGPEIRIGGFQNDATIELLKGDNFILDTDLAEDTGTPAAVSVTHKDLARDVRPGDCLMLADGRIELRVVRCTQTRVYCEVLVGGPLSGNKGLNRKGGGLSADALTEKDEVDIAFAVAIDADFIAPSFVKTEGDVHRVRRLIEQANGLQMIISKIETVEAINNLERIVAASGGVMVARGDLGVECEPADLPALQQRIIHVARSANKVVIVATQMMESMIHEPIPTRAEVFDVANAVLNGTDAVMLSAETAIGQHPDKVIQEMSKICERVEKQIRATTSQHRIGSLFDAADESIAMATMYLANHTNARCIAALTESGFTALYMSRISSGKPIYALSSHENTRRRVSLFRGVFPIAHDPQSTEHASFNQEVIEQLKRVGAVKDGDTLLITKGDLQGQRGGTNALKIITVT